MEKMLLAVILDDIRITRFVSTMRNLTGADLDSILLYSSNEILSCVGINDCDGSIHQEYRRKVEFATKSPQSIIRDRKQAFKIYRFILTKST